MKIKKGFEKEYQEFYRTNGEDGYSRCTRDYVIAWADLMEKGINDGKSIYEIADSTSHEADTEGITGFMFGCAVSILAHFWEYGEDIRKWHKGEYDYSGDGVVNPAIISIET